METPAALRSLSHRPPSTPATTSNTAIRSSSLNQVLLHDWWLIRADSDSHGKRMGIGGFTFRQGTDARRFFLSAPIVKRKDAVTLKTVDDITVMVLGSLNKFRTLANGFSHEVCDHFVIGFPYYWEEFADLSVHEERAILYGSKEVPCSDSYTTTSPRDHGADTLDSTPIHSMVSVDHNTTHGKKRRIDISNVEYSGPWTRSRARRITKSMDRSNDAT